MLAPISDQRVCTVACAWPVKTAVLHQEVKEPTLTSLEGGCRSGRSLSAPPTKMDMLCPCWSSLVCPGCDVCYSLSIVSNSNLISFQTSQAAASSGLHLQAARIISPPSRARSRPSLRACTQASSATRFAAAPGALPPWVP